MSILDKHKLEMKNYNFIDININAKVINDHRKVMCFITSNKKVNKEINFKNYNGRPYYSDRSLSMDNVLVGNSEGIEYVNIIKILFDSIY